MTLTELIDDGVTAARLPHWNDHAFVVPRAEGPWADLFDIGHGVGSGEPLPVLIGECDQDNRWIEAHA